MNLKYHKGGIGETERHLIDTMAASGRFVLTAEDLQTEFKYSRAVANLMLSRLCKKGWLQRLKVGVYRIVPLGSFMADSVPEDAWAVATIIYSPCYISGWSAAEYWDLTEQIFNSTVVFTAKKQKKCDQKIAGLNYRTKMTHRKNLFGIKKIWSSNVQIQIADIHKTIIDILADPAIGGGGRHTMDIIKSYWQKKEASAEIIWDYTEKLNNGAVFRRLGYIAECIVFLPKQWIEKCSSKVKSGIIKFDPVGPNVGSIISKWGLRINIPQGDVS